MPQTVLPFGVQSSTVSVAPSSTLSDHDIADSIEAFEINNLRGSVTPSSTQTIFPTPSKGKPRGRTAWVYKYMRDNVSPQHLFLSAAGKPEWRCRFCLQNYDLSGGTLNPKLHLNREHDILEDSPMGKRARNVQIDIETAINSATENPQKRRKLHNNENTSSIPLNGNVVEVLYTKFIATCNQPLRLVECPEFRAFLTYLNSDIDIWLAVSHTTIAIWVQRQYLIEKKLKVQRVQSAQSRIHISMDLWTSQTAKPSW